MDNLDKFINKFKFTKEDLEYYSENLKSLHLDKRSLLSDSEEISVYWAEQFVKEMIKDLDVKSNGEKK